MMLIPPPHDFAYQSVEVLKRAEAWIGITVGCDIIAEILHWRWIGRREPDRIDPQRIRCAVAQIIESGNNARDVSDPIAVRALKLQG